MNFATLRLGKTSVSDIEKIDALLGGAQTPPYVFETKCTQVPALVKPGTFVFIWLGSDNPKGGATKWVQGFRAIGRVTRVEGEVYREEFTLEISVGYVFSQSVGRRDLLREASDAYYWCSEAPIIGLDDRANQTVRIIEDGELSSVSAIFYGFGACEPSLHSRVATVYPQLTPYLTYVPPNPRVVHSKEIEEGLAVDQNLKRNLIYFGAPGTGKSFQLDRQAAAFSKLDAEGRPRVARVTFHPRYSYFHFVGSYKPITWAEGEANAGEIYYAFVPGPLTTMLVKAMNNPDEDYLLILEEINRADTAGVFGDVFQLLDRTLLGYSAYPITTSDELGTYLKKALSSEGKSRLAGLGGHCDTEVQIVLPPNLFLWATMNSADQGVFPLDSAFKRRWDFRYVSIDEGQELCSWNDERVALNNLLKSVAKVNEDKLIGPFFLSKDIEPRDDDGSITDEFSEAFANKVLMYLVEDAAKYTMPSLVNLEHLPEGPVLSDYLKAWHIYNFGMFAGCVSWNAPLAPVEKVVEDTLPKGVDIGPGKLTGINVEYSSGQQ